MPERGDTESIQALANCFADSGRFGSRMLSKNAHRYVRTLKVAEKQYSAIERNVGTLNGVKLRSTDPQKAQHAVAKRFYLSLSTAGLRAQCKLLGVEYDSYNTQEEIVAALVQKHRALNV